MIGEAIKREGEKGSGGGADAFTPGVAYVCGKAARVELRTTFRVLLPTVLG